MSRCRTLLFLVAAGLALVGCGADRPTPPPPAPPPPSLATSRAQEELALAFGAVQAWAQAHGGRVQQLPQGLLPASAAGSSPIQLTVAPRGQLTLSQRSAAGQLCTLTAPLRSPAAGLAARVRCR